MKLPEVNYRRMGVQSKGRKNIHLPGKAAGQEFRQATALGQANVRAEQEKWAGIVHGLDEVSKVAFSLAKSEEEQAYYKQVMDYETKVGVSSAELTSSAMVDLDTIELPDLAKGVLNDYPQTTNADGKVVRMAPSHEVMDSIHKARLTQWRGEAMGGFSGATREKFLRATHSISSNSTKAVFAKGTQDRSNMATASASINFDNAIDHQDSQLAEQVARSALNSGAWAPEVYAKNMMSMAERIDEKFFGRKIALAQTSGQLDALVDQMTTEGNNLSGSLERSLVNSALTRIDRMETKEEKRMNKIKSDRKIGVMRNIDQKGLTLSQLYQMEGQIDPSQFLTFRTAIMSRDRERVGGGGVSSSPETVVFFNNRVAGLQFPDDGMDTAVQVAKIKQEAFNAMVGGDLSYGAYKQVNADVDKFSQVNYNTPEHKSTREIIALDVVGSEPVSAFAAAMASGSSEMLAAVKKQNRVVAQARGDLQTYMRHAGVNADPRKWWENNKARYTPEGQKLSRAGQYSAAFPANARYSPSGTLDSNATDKNMRDRVKRGLMSPAEYDQQYRVLFIGRDLSPEQYMEDFGVEGPLPGQMSNPRPRLIQ